MIPLEITPALEARPKDLWGRAISNGMRIVLFTALFLVLSAGMARAETSMPTSTFLLLPDSPFYFVKTVEEKIRLFLIRSLEAQAQAYMKLAEVRLEEYKRLLEKKKDVLAEQTLSKSKEFFVKAREKFEEARQGGAIEAAGARFGERFNVHYIKGGILRGFEALKNLISAFGALITPKSP